MEYNFLSLSPSFRFSGILLLTVSMCLGACSSYESGQTIDLTVGGKHRVEEVAQAPLDKENAGDEAIDAASGALLPELKTFESNKKAQIYEI